MNYYEPTSNLNMSGLLRIIIGQLICLIDIHVGGFDILPDAVGAILIFIGLSALTKYSEHFNRAKPFTILLMVISIIKLIPIQSLLSHQVFIEVGKLTGLFDIILSVLSLWLLLTAYFYILSGVSTVAEKAGRSALAKQSLQCFQLMKRVLIISFGLYLLSQLVGFLGWLSYVSTVITLAVEIYYVYILILGYRRLHNVFIDPV